MGESQGEKNASILAEELFFTSDVSWCVHWESRVRQSLEICFLSALWCRASAGEQERGFLGSSGALSEAGRGGNPAGDADMDMELNLAFLSLSLTFTSACFRQDGETCNFSCVPWVLGRPRQSPELPQCRLLLPRALSCQAWLMTPNMCWPHTRPSLRKLQPLRREVIACVP